MAINKAIILGNAGRDPEVHEFPDGGLTAQFSIATTDKGYTRQDGTQVPDRTEWHNIVCRGGLAKVARDYIHRGDKVYVEGSIHTRSFEKDGRSTYVTEIHATALELLTPKQQTTAPQQSAQPAQQPQYTYQQAMQAAEAARQYTQPQPAPQPTQTDLPF